MWNRLMTNIDLRCPAVNERLRPEFRTNAMANPVPAGFHTLTAHLIVPEGDKAVAFYRQAFGAQELLRVMTPNGHAVMLVQLKIGDSIFMLGSEYAPIRLSPKRRGGTSVYLHLYVPDVAASFAQAVKAGCVVRMPLSNAFWGDRHAVVEDPFGHLWALATRMHDYTPQQIAANAKAFIAGLMDDASGLTKP